MTNLLRRSTEAILLLFVVGWATWSFAILNVGPYSVTLLLLASGGILLIAFVEAPRVPSGAWALYLSTCIAFLVGALSIPSGSQLFTHLLQALLAIGVLVGATRIDWLARYPAFKNSVVAVGAILVAFAFYQAIARAAELPWAFLPITNLQLIADQGLQRGFTTGLQRVSSVFAEPSDLGRFMLWVVAVAAASPRSALRTLGLAAGTAGVVVSQSLGAVVVLFVIILASAVLNRSFRPLILVGGSAVAVSVMLVLAFPSVLEGIGPRTQAIAIDGLDYLYSTGRFSSVALNFEMFWNRPLFGHGLGYIGSTDLASVNSGLQVLLIERGLVGTTLFLGPYCATFTALSVCLFRERDTAPEVVRSAWSILMIELMAFLWFATIYFPPSYLALGIGIAAGALRRDSMRGRRQWSLPHLPPNLRRKDSVLTGGNLDR